MNFRLSAMPIQRLAASVAAAMILFVGACDSRLADPPVRHGVVGDSRAKAVGVPLSLGLARHPSHALAIIAHRQGYFAEQGLDVALAEYRSDGDARQGLELGEVDVACVQDEELLARPMNQDQTVIVAVIGNEYRGPALDGHRPTVVVAATRRFAQSHPDALNKLPRAFEQAENLAQQQPERALSIVSAVMSADRETVRDAWGRIDLHVRRVNATSEGP